MTKVEGCGYAKSVISDAKRLLRTPGFSHGAHCPGCDKYILVTKTNNGFTLNEKGNDCPQNPQSQQPSLN